MFSKPARTAFIAATAAVAVVVGGSAAYSAYSGSNGKGEVLACFKRSDGALRVVSRFPCKSGEQQMTWNVKGQKGNRGATGAVGAAGAAGEVGLEGEKGDPGSAGAKGDAGSAGPKGDTGLAGPQGAAGPQGIAGPQGVSGPQGASGARGPSGLSASAESIKGSNLTALDVPAGVQGASTFTPHLSLQVTVPADGKRLVEGHLHTRVKQIDYTQACTGGDFSGQPALVLRVDGSPASWTRYVAPSGVNGVPQDVDGTFTRLLSAGTHTIEVGMSSSGCGSAPTAAQQQISDTYLALGNAGDF